MTWWFIVIAIVLAVLALLFVLFLLVKYGPKLIGKCWEKIQKCLMGTGAYERGVDRANNIMNRNAGT